MKSSKQSSIVFKFADLDDWKHPLVAVREQGRSVAVVVGVFELLHTEHVKLLEAARSFADWILVGVESDHVIQTRYGPQRPLVPEAERAELVAGFEAVDEVVLLHDQIGIADLLREAQPDWVVMKRGSHQLSLPSGCRIHWVDMEPDRTETLLKSMLR